MDRRTFLASLSGLTTGLLVHPHSSAGADSDRWGDLLPQRKLGATGEAVTMLGLGGWHAGRMGERDFDVCQMPVNAADPSYESFIRGVLPTLVERNMGVLAMKTLANGGFFGGSQHGRHGNNPRLVPGVLSIREAIHFAWSMPISVLITGPDNKEQLLEKVDLAHSFVSMTSREQTDLIDRAARLAGQRVEFYKA